jgi:FkbM family methyltransferase
MVSAGTLLRLVGVTDRTALPILSGPLKSARWTVASSVVKCWLGCYEREKLNKMRRILTPGGVVYDVGAQAGYHALLAARCVGPTGHVYAFEPLPRNQQFLERNIALNRTSNIELVRAAVSDHDGLAAFDPGPGFMAGHLAGRGAFQVACVSLDEWFGQGGRRPPTLLKIDAEGAEAAVLRGAASLLMAYHPVVLLDTHDFLGGACAGIHDRCVGMLEELGYQVTFTLPKQFAGEICAVAP